MSGLLGGQDEGLALSRKLRQVSWSLVVLLVAIAGIGFAMLYSVADGAFSPWASRQMARFATGLLIMLGIAMVDIRVWMRLAYPFYALAFLLLLLVEAVGIIGMGAQRWVDLGPFQIQPSELMKIALVLALARYCHPLTLHQVSRPLVLLPPLLLVAAPVALVLRQPDLGTAMLLLFGAATLLFLAGVNWRYFAAAAALAAAAVPVAWTMLHDYQRARVLTFLNPESDPLGSGYHILQSKIALGSGGLFGKGYLAGTQSHLNFLPEKQTDFIFTMLGEEFGLVGGLTVLTLYALVLACGFGLMLQIRHQFGRLVAAGICATFFFYVFINIAMVMGLVPVVGVPLPFLSYGGTAMMTLLIGFGFLLSAAVHRDAPLHHGPNFYG
jgi:rod shape determining protein RodA